MAMNTALAAMPTRRAAAPVRSVTATLVDSSVFGTVPATPHTRLPRPAVATAPCTARKSTARRRRQETR